MKFEDYVLWILVMTSLFLGIHNYISTIDVNLTLEWQSKIVDSMLETQGVILEIIDAITGTAANELNEKLLNLNKLLMI